MLLCDPATTPAEPLIAKLLLDPAPDLEATWKRAGFDRCASPSCCASPIPAVPPSALDSRDNFKEET